MAETSITINDVVFVVDCGKAKETSYDALNNTSLFASILDLKGCCTTKKRKSWSCSTCLQLGSISEFLSRALQPPEPLSVQNAVDYLKVIGALDENENLTVLGRHLSVLPVEPKLGKMLIYGAVFNCLDPIMTIVAGLSVRDPFVMPFDKKDLAESTKAQFSAHDCSDHLALVLAYNGWKDSERQQSGYEYCWKNFLSAQILKAIDSLRKQFFYLLKDTGLVDQQTESCNTWSTDVHLIRAVICAGLFPGLCSVVDGHLQMLGGYLEFFMKPTLGEMYLSLKRELEELIQNKLVDPKLDIQSQNELLMVIRLLVSEDQCEGRFVFGRQLAAPSKKAEKAKHVAGDGGDNSKNELQTLLSRAGHGAPAYKTK